VTTFEDDSSSLLHEASSNTVEESFIARHMHIAQTIIGLIQHRDIGDYG